MSRVLPARLAPTRLVPYRWSGGSFGAGVAVDLAISPTRLVTPRRVAKVGDTVVITETLKGFDGAAQDLPTGSSVVLNLVSPTGALLANRKLVTILQTGSGNSATNKGGVTVTLPPSTGIPAGVSFYEFEATLPDGSVLTFPDDSNGELTVIAELG